MQPSFKTKNQFVYEHLREGILSGRLPPGTRIVVGEVAAALGVSDIPVRESLQRLESEGLVTLTPHVGARVTPIDLAGLSELYLMRSVLEALAARLAADVLSAADFGRLQELNGAMRAAGERGDAEAAGQLNWAFHEALCRPVGYPRLLRTVSDLRDATRRFQALFSLVPERIAVSVAEHEAILEALKARDGALAEELVRRHCEGALALLRAHYRQAAGAEATAAADVSGASASRGTAAAARPDAPGRPGAGRRGGRRAQGPSG